MVSQEFVRTATKGNKEGNMEEFIEVFRKYAVFNGRSRRREFWMFQLINFIIFYGIGGLWHFVFGAKGVMSMIVGACLLIYLFASILPNIAVTVRRLHDTGRSGWWYLISFVPLLGLIVLVLFTVMDSAAGSNRYGPNPKTI